MTVQELQAYADLAPRWTEACPVEHGVGVESARGGDTAMGRPVAAGFRNRPSARAADRLGPAPVPVRRVRPVGGRQGAYVSVAPGRRVLTGPATAVRACSVEAPAQSGVVDDVPTWVLAACGIALGVLMLLAVAFLGGPAYV